MRELSTCLSLQGKNRSCRISELRCRDGVDGEVFANPTEHNQASSMKRGRVVKSHTVLALYPFAAVGVFILEVEGSAHRVPMQRSDLDRTPYSSTIRGVQEGQIPLRRRNQV